MLASALVALAVARAVPIVVWALPDRLLLLEGRLPHLLGVLTIELISPY